MSCAEMRWSLIVEGSCCGAVVLFPLDVAEAERDLHLRLASDLERARMARFHSKVHRARFLVAHGRLRQLLAAQLGVAPEVVDFAVGPFGKPMLAGEAARSGLQFNLSHSGPVGLVGWSEGRAIGVDVEVWRPMRDAVALVRRYFSAAEGDAWESEVPARRQEAFFNLWTRKEAYVKALGRGLTLPLNSFDVSHASGGGEHLLRPSDAFAGDHAWSVTAPVSGSGVSVAVAVAGRSCHVVSGA